MLIVVNAKMESPCILMKKRRFLASFTGARLNIPIKTPDKYCFDNWLSLVG
jgi:hypothetical protein